MKKILFKLLLTVVGKFLARRFGMGRYGGYYPGGRSPFHGGGFYHPYKYKRKKSKLGKLLDFLR